MIDIFLLEQLDAFARTGTLSRAAEELHITQPALSRNMSHQNLSAVMQRLGFKKVHRAKGNGWLVIEKNPGEINTEAICSPNECAETYLKPYRTIATDSQNGSDQQ